MVTGNAQLQWLKPSGHKICTVVNSLRALRGGWLNQDREKGFHILAHRYSDSQQKDTKHFFCRHAARYKSTSTVFFVVHSTVFLKYSTVG